jgi:phage baseplate assembly protein W
MVQLYLTVPLNCQDITAKGRQPRCGLEDSIRQHIHLILSTHFKEHRFDPDFGNLVWEKDFETIQSVSRWKNELSEDISQALQHYEKRLWQIQVETVLDELRILDPQTQKVSELRKRVTIRIAGKVRQTDEHFQHTEFIFFSPLSLT